MDTGICIMLIAFLFSTVVANDGLAADTKNNLDDVDGNREPKLSIFQVVKFTNSHCTGSTKNGTCFTSQECDNIGGVQDGTCADGFGVCCTVTITTGGSSSVNNTYIQVSSSTNLDVGDNKYVICPCSDDICRIKFDFESFDIEGPASGFYYATAETALTGATDTQQANYGNTVGQCATDTFQIVSPSGRNSPLICGDNDNQHMILDTCGTECLTVHLGIGTTTSSATRELDIRVIQYRCGDEQGGPAGCLQYFENTTGKIRSFNFPDASPGTTMAAGYAVHLANQHYKACIRRGNGKEAICYVPCTSTAGDDGGANTQVTAQPSFGLSLAEEETSSGATETDCSTDYIWIPNGRISTQFTTAIAAQDEVPEGAENLQPNRFCGRYFQTPAVAIYTAAVSICSVVTPFVLGVDFDNYEICNSEADTAGMDNEPCEGFGAAAEEAGGSGSLGFALCYVQHTPPIA